MSAPRHDTASITSRKTLRQQAEENVEAVRGSADVPGFDACVKAEEARLATNAALEEAAKIAEGDGGGWNNTPYGRSVAARISEDIRKLKEGE